MADDAQKSNGPSRLRHLVSFFGNGGTLITRGFVGSANLLSFKQSGLFSSVNRRTNFEHHGRRVTDVTNGAANFVHLDVIGQRGTKVRSISIGPQSFTERVMESTTFFDILNRILVERSCFLTRRWRVGAAQSERGGIDRSEFPQVRQQEILVKVLFFSYCNAFDRTCDRSLPFRIFGNRPPFGHLTLARCRGAHTLVTTNGLS